MTSNGSDRTLLADEAGWLTSCGPFVVFASYKGGAITLTRANLDASHATKLVENDLWKPSRTSLSARSPACSPDGKFVFFVGTGGPRKIYRVPIEGGTRMEISETPGDFIVGRLSVSPDGKLLAYLYEQYRGTTPGWKFAVVSTEGGPTLKTFQAPGGIQGPRWSPDGSGLQYLITDNGTTNIWEQPLTGEAPRRLTRFVSGHVFDFNWSQDGTHLLMTRGSRNSDVILISNLAVGTESSCIGKNKVNFRFAPELFSIRLRLIPFHPQGNSQDAMECKMECDTTDTGFCGTPANRRNYRNCSGRSDSLVTL